MSEYIVVGIDGSSPAQEALEWAAAEAQLRQVPLEVIHTWSLPPSSPSAGIEGVVDAIESAAQKVLDDAVAHVASIAPGVEVDGRTVPGGAGSVLVDASRNASLVVVGARGRGGFTSLLLGSVSSQVVQHAECPVVVVRRGTVAQPAAAGHEER